MANADTTYTDNAFGFIDVSKYFSGFTVTSESYRCNMHRSNTNRLLRYKGENPRITLKVFYDRKIKIQSFRSKPFSNVKHMKQFIGHNFRIGKPKK